MLPFSYELLSGFFVLKKIIIIIIIIFLIAYGPLNSPLESKLLSRYPKDHTKSYIGLSHCIIVKPI